MLIAPPLVWGYLRPPRWRGKYIRGERTIFPTAAMLQVAGVFVAYVMAVMLLYAASTHKRMEPQVVFLMALFFVAGISVLFRQVELDPEGLTKRYLFFKRRVRWSEVQSAKRLSDGSWILIGGFRRLVLDRHYCDFELLILQIADWINSQEQAGQRLSFEETCRQLQKDGLLPEGEIPIFPERLPQHDDPENYGINFFRTQLDHTVNLSNMSLARCFIGRSEVRGTLFVNSDLRQSNLCWNNFSHVNFSDALLAGADLRSSVFVETRFLRANLRGVDLRHSSFERCSFEEASMENAILTREQGGLLNLSEPQTKEIDWRDNGGPEPPGG
jgi:uncharacterized protein YjbI with pentapeptide repeats